MHMGLVNLKLAEISHKKKVHFFWFDFIYVMNKDIDTFNLVSFV